mmetsp:Transcript_128579/g.222099  ORF Transcript_128579/g.222099 Transcript_128579/m.222099 type:complete len:223 (-) Transcript_128579:447-1115(-)
MQQRYYSTMDVPTGNPPQASSLSHKVMMVFAMAAAFVCGVNAIARVTSKVTHPASRSTTLVQVHQATRGIRPPVAQRTTLPPLEASKPDFEDQTPPRQMQKSTATLSPMDAATTAAALSFAAAGPAYADVGAVAGILGFLSSALNFYQLILFVRILMTWFPQLDTSSMPWRAIAAAGDPVLNGSRGLVPPIAGLDFGPTLVLLALNYVCSSFDDAVAAMSGY